MAKTKTIDFSEEVNSNLEKHKSVSVGDLRERFETLIYNVSKNDTDFYTSVSHDGDEEENFKLLQILRTNKSLQKMLLEDETLMVAIAQALEEKNQLETPKKAGNMSVEPTTMDNTKNTTMKHRKHRAMVDLSSSNQQTPVYSEKGINTSEKGESTVLGPKLDPEIEIKSIKTVKKKKSTKPKNIVAKKGKKDLSLTPNKGRIKPTKSKTPVKKAKASNYTPITERMPTSNNPIHSTRSNQTQGYFKSEEQKSEGTMM